MENLPWNIEQIVNEVVRRLQKQPIKDTNEHSSDNPSNKKTLEITDRVITLSTIEGRLSGINTLITEKNAITTPSVKDELRRRNIEITQSVEKKPASRAKLILCISHEKYDAQSLKKSLEQFTNNIILRESLELPSAIRQLIAELSQPQCLGICITKIPEVALCLANRSRRIRAIHGYDKQTLQKTAQSIGANLLILDPQNHLLTETSDLIKEFLHAGCFESPVKYQKYLD